MTKTSSPFPAAEFDVTTELVARLVADQHPDLAGPLSLHANGWDNAIYRLGAERCVRLPRRRVAVELIRNEQRWLPVLAERLPAPIPVPVRAGDPGAGYPWPWTIGPWFAGEPAADVPVPLRGNVATELAAFVTSLHTTAPADAPRNPVRGVPLAARSAAVCERLGTGVIPRSAELRALWERLVATPAWAGPPRWLHGDLHPANLLLRKRSDARDARDDWRLAAVIDFGDLTAGDPACDLAVAWLLFDPPARALFRAALPDVDDDTWNRAHGWALNLSTAIALHTGDPRMDGISAHGIAQVLFET